MRLSPFIPIGALLLAPALAIEGPEDNTPPPPAAPVAGNRQERADTTDRESKASPRQQNQEAAFLGVITTPVPEMFAGHLGLEPGQGVIIRSLIPNGPAAAEGIAANDIITRFNGRNISSAEELSREVSALKPGDKAELTLIHNGKTSRVTVTLGTRPKELAGQFEPAPRKAPLDRDILDGIPEEFADRILGMIERNLGDIDIDDARQAFRGLDQGIPDMEEALREMKERMRQAMNGMDNFQIPPSGVQLQQNSTTIRLMDEEGSVEVESVDGSKEVTVRDKDNNIIWEGHWNTESDKQAAPDEIRERLNNLDLDTKQMKLRFGDN